MPCLIVFICLGLPHENYTFGDSSETKYAVKPKKQSQGGLSGAIISTPDPLDFLETLKGSSKRQGEQLLRYNPQKHPLGAAPVLQPHLWTKLAELLVQSTSRSGTWGFAAARTSNRLAEIHRRRPIGFLQHSPTAPLDQVGRAASLNQLQGAEPGVSPLQGSAIGLQI